jgi:hypothetical protein
MNISLRLASILFILFVVAYAGAQEIVFEDDFDGSAGDAPDPAKWETIIDRGSIALDGRGHLVMTGVENWFAAVLESKFAIPGRGADTYEVEYRVILPEYAPHYIGLISAGGAVGPTHHRAFMTQGITPSYQKPRSINLTTSISGHVSGALSSDLEVGEVEAGQKVAIQFPLTDETMQTRLVWLDKDGKEQEKTYSLRVRGFDVVDIWPRDDNVVFPFFSNPAYRKDEVQWKKITRFAPENEGYW